MATMHAAVLTAPHRFELREVPRPQIGPDEVLIRVLRTGICGTDLHMFHGNYAADRLPIIPGHEFCGTVEEVGAKHSHLHPGQRVVADINIGCGHCFWCRRNEVLSCPDMAQVGISRDGAFAEFVALPGRLVIPAPEDVAPEILALTEPVACVVRAARKANAGLGQSVVVLGAGPVGNLHVQMMRLVGAAPIIVADLSHERLAMASEAGADVVVHDPAELERSVCEITDRRGADLVIESVGLVSLYETAFKLIRKGGHVAFFGLTGPDGAVSLPILPVILQENSLKGSVAGMGQDMHDALNLLVHGRFRTDAFTKATYPLWQIQEAFETLADRPGDLKTQIEISAN